MEQIRNFKDFLKLYNQISDACFTRCANSFMTREVEPDEAKCVDACAQKFIFTNHRIMDTYVEVQAKIVQKRIEEMTAAQNQIDANNAALTEIEPKL